MAQVKLTKIGNSMGVILPKSVIDRLMVENGDSLHIIDTKNGIELTPYDPEFAAQMEVARKVMKRRRAVLHELAK